MDEKISKKEWLDNLRLTEGDQFAYDEAAILAAYKSQEDNQSSLAIKMLSIFGGLLATIAILVFIVFLVITDLIDDKIGLLVFGSGFIVSAIILNKLSDKIIIDTFSISIYITGLVLLALGLEKMGLSESTTTVIILLIALSSLIITQNFILSFISVLVISGGFIFLFVFYERGDLIHLYISVYTLLLTGLFLNEAKIISASQQLSRLFDPLRIGLLISLLFGLLAVSKRDLISVSQDNIWWSSVLMILVILYLISIILKINKVNATKIKGMVYAMSALILAATVFAPAILGAIIIILLSFLVNHKTGLAIGIIALIYFTGQYYYDLSFTLLTKSIILFVSGIIFLGLHYLTTQNIATDEEI